MINKSSLRYLSLRLCLSLILIGNGFIIFAQTAENQIDQDTVVLKVDLSTETGKMTPAWAWFGGLLGAAYVASTTVLGPRLGAAALLALTLAGQMVAALVVDKYGVVGFPQSAITPARLLGAVLVIAGALLIVRR